MTEPTEPLKNCPFCGAGESQIHVNKGAWNGRGYGEPVSVEVRHWCADVPGQPSRMISRAGRDEASAIAAWNTRTTPQPTQSVLAQAAPQPAVQQGDADVEGAIKSAFFRFFGAGAERDWHTEPGGWFIEGYRAAHPAAPVAQGDAEQRQMDAKHAAIYRWMLSNVPDAWNIINNWCLYAEAGTDELHDALAARAQAKEGDQHG